MNIIEKGILEAAKASNGGGVIGSRFPQRPFNRLMKQGLLENKKGYSGLLDLVVITKAGRQALAEEQLLQESKDEPANDGSDPRIL